LITIMQKQLRTKQLVLMAGTLSLFLVLGYGYAVWKIFDMNRTVQALEADVQLQLSREDLGRKAGTLLSETAQERSKLDSLLLADNEIVPFLEHIEGIGEIADVTLDVKTVDVIGSEEKQDVYEWLKISVTADGSWIEVYHFLSLLEHIPLALVVDRVDLTVLKEEDKSTNMWDGRFDFRVAKRKPPSL